MLKKMEGRKVTPKPHCPECDSTKILKHYETLETLCGECGYVIKEAELDTSHPEKRIFNNEQLLERSRTGPPTSRTIHDGGKGTVIGWKDVDRHGKKIKGKERAQIYRLRKWQTRCRVSDATERNLSMGFSEISRIANNMSLPKIVTETASVIYRKAAEEGLIRGRSIIEVTASSVYAACRQCKIPRTPDEVCKASDVDKKGLTRSYRFLVKELGYFMPIEDYRKYITKFCNQTGMSGKTEEIACKIYEAAKRERLTAGRGKGKAAAACYVATVLVGEKKTQREIAENAGVTEVTIRNRYKELSKKLQFDIYL